MDLSSKSNKEVCIYLASRIRAERLRQGYSQATMSNKTGIPLRTYKRIELTGLGSIDNLVTILRTHDRIRAIEVLLPAPVAKPRPSIVERAMQIAEAAKQKKWR